MHVGLGTALLGAALSLSWAQETRQPSLTAEQILEKSIEATGGRRAIEKVTSTLAKGLIEIGPQGMRAVFELYAKAPDKRLVVTKIEGFGEVRQGCDGKLAWSEDPNRGLRVLEGPERDATLRECIFNAEIKWRELYTKVELAGIEKAGDREAYRILMTPSSGQPVTSFFDAENFLLIRQVSTRDTPSGLMEIRADLSDYREVDGIKVPFLIKQTMPVAEVQIKIAEVNNNVAIDEARFAKPEAK